MKEKKLPRTIGLYIHVPFCVQRCPYCAFYSLENVSDATINSYPELILQELALRLQDWRGSQIGSIYFGGGTPSLLKSAAVRQILEAVRAEFRVDPNAEITLEANPGTLNPHALDELLAAGINRLSLGVQALNDDRLRFLGRIHDRREALKALQMARSCGCPQVSADLMVGTPLETVVGWDRELDELFAFLPEGISYYSLTLEEGTRLAERAASGENVYLPAEVTVDLLLHAADRLRSAGYRHYEVSNWALPGAECRHNLHYWRRGAFLGLGPSAHSFDGIRRSWNLSDLPAYAEALSAGKAPPSDSELLGEEEIHTEWVYLRLRQEAGLNFLDYQRDFGAPAPPYWRTMFARIAQRGLGDFDGVHFRPNDKGLLLADEIAMRILG